MVLRVLVSIAVAALSYALYTFVDIGGTSELDKLFLKAPYTFQMAQGQNLSAFVLGGTGAVGKEIIKALAAAPEFTRVTLIGRRQVPLPTPDEDKRYDKFDEKIINFDKLEEHENDFKGYDVGFSSLGTTRAKSGAAGFYKVDHDYVVGTAKLAKSGGTKHFHLISSGGANKNSYFLYMKTKGEVEEELKDLGFSRLSIYRPALLLPAGGREDTRIAEAISRAILKPLDFCGWFSTDCTMLGRVVVQNTFRKENQSVEILDNKAIHGLNKNLPKE